MAADDGFDGGSSHSYRQEPSKRKRASPSVRPEMKITGAGGPIQIAPVVKPISRMGSVVTNVYVSRKLVSTRRQAEEQARSRGDPVSEYPDGHVNSYDVMPAQLLFRSFRLPDTAGGTPIADEQSEFVFSAFNLFERNRVAVCVGVADDKVVLNDPQNMTLTSLLPCALQGTRTIWATGTQCFPGDELCWGMPKVRYVGGKKVPNFEVKGIPSDTYMPEIYPLDFTRDGQLNMYANLVSMYFGTWEGNSELDTGFTSYKNMLLRMEDRWAAAFAGSRDDLAKAFASPTEVSNAAIITQSFTRKCSDLQKLSEKEQEARANFRASMCQLEELRTEHYMFWIKRRFGYALEQSSTRGLNIMAARR